MFAFCLISYHVGAQEAFLDKTLLYRDEVVKKCIYQLAIPCYSVILSTPQTAISLAHAKKVMVKLALTGEEKVIVMNCPAVNDNFRISVGKKDVEPLLTSSKFCNYRIYIFGPLLSSVESESVCDQTFRSFDIFVS